MEGSVAVCFLENCALSEELQRNRPDVFSRDPLTVAAASSPAQVNLDSYITKLYYIFLLSILETTSPDHGGSGFMTPRHEGERILY
jgi:hypothetical protein